MTRLLGWLSVSGAIATLSVAPAIEAASAKPAASPQAAMRVYRMDMMQAFEPGWLPDSKRLAFLGNRQIGEPSQVYVWEPLSGQVWRATTKALPRHSLAVSEQGKLAYVEQQASPSTQEPLEGNAENLHQQGPNNLIVQDLQTSATQAVFTQGWVQPGSVAWSPDGERLAFVTIDRFGLHRLALVAPGQKPALVQLDQEYEIQNMVGWANDREVLLRANPRVNGTPGPEVLLGVGRQGIRTYRKVLDSKVSPDGRWLLSKHSQAGGVDLRLLSGGTRVLHNTALGFDWAPAADRVYATADRDVLALNLKGKVLRRWPNLGTMSHGQVTVSPDGKHVAIHADSKLTVVPVR